MSKQEDLDIRILERIVDNGGSAAIGLGGDAHGVAEDLQDKGLISLTPTQYGASMARFNQDSDIFLGLLGKPENSRYANALQQRGVIIEVEGRYFFREVTA